MWGCPGPHQAPPRAAWLSTTAVGLLALLRISICLNRPEYSWGCWETCEAARQMHLKQEVPSPPQKASYSSSPQARPFPGEGTCSLPLQGAVPCGRSPSSAMLAQGSLCGKRLPSRRSRNNYRAEGGPGRPGLGGAERKCSGNFYRLLFEETFLATSKGAGLVPRSTALHNERGLHSLTASGAVHPWKPGAISPWGTPPPCKTRSLECTGSFHLQRSLGVHVPSNSRHVLACQDSPGRKSDRAHLWKESGRLLVHLRTPSSRSR